MAKPIPPTLSVLVSVWMETLFYGFNFLIYILCVYVYFSRLRASNFRATVTLLVVSTLLFSVATAHVAINLRRLILGYVKPSTKAEMTTFLLDVSQPTNVAKQFMVVFANLFSDALIVWRVFTVWHRQYLVCLPVAFMALGVFITGMASPIIEISIVPGQSIFLARLTAWGTAQFSLSLATNVTATCLIAGKIWFITRDIRRLNQRSHNQYWRLVVLLIESASFAAFAQLLELAFYASKFPGVFFIADSTVQIISIAPLSIIVFVGLTQRNTSNVYGTTYENDLSKESDFDETLESMEFARRSKVRERIPVNLGKGETTGNASSNRFSSNSNPEDKDDRVAFV